MYMLTATLIDLYRILKCLYYSTYMSATPKFCKNVKNEQIAMVLKKRGCPRWEKKKRKKVALGLNHHINRYIKLQANLDPQKP